MTSEMMILRVLLEKNLDAGLLRGMISLANCSLRIPMICSSLNRLVEIEFRSWTDDGKLRHPSFKGLRDAADEARIYRL